jgi:TRAP-type C4-dicarboxylate transport system substrate-binding protein
MGQISMEKSCLPGSVLNETQHADHQKIVADTFDAQALEQRIANQKLDSSLEEVLKKQGMAFIPVDGSAFRAVLTETGFYKNWETKFGAPLWSALESYTGSLA